MNAPKNISPLIRAGRWAFFLGGMAYGSSRLASLKVSDAPLREAAIKKATEEHYKHLAEVEKSNKDNMIMLAQAAGVKV